MKWFNRKIFIFNGIKIYSINLLISSLSAFSVSADIANNLKAEIEEPNFSQPNISSTQERNHLNGVIFARTLEQIDNKMNFGFLLGEDICSPLKLQPILSLGLNPLIEMPLYSNSYWVMPLLSERDERVEQQILEEEYFLLINNFFE